MEKDSSQIEYKEEANKRLYSYSDNEDFMQMEGQKQVEIDFQPSFNQENKVIQENSRINSQNSKRKRNISTRVCIDSIILQNFKSYEGIQKLGPFHKSFTSIVGPNGSGKSNLIESLLFIFGFSAAWMRQTKLGQLIHRSKNSNNNTRTSVQVVFNKIEQESEDKYTVLESFTVKRSVNNNNVSKYSINGYECHQKDVKAKLLSEGIDLNNNRFLILQGQVQQISSMQQKSGDPNKPGLLQYLEQIIGSSKYQEELNKLYLQYTSNEQRKHERGQIMKIFENQLRGMSQLKNEAVKYIDLETFIYKLENILIQIGLNQENLELKKIDEKHVELQKERDLVVEQEKQKLQKQKQRIKQIKRNKQEIESITKILNQQQQSLNKLQLADGKTAEQILFKSEDLGKYQKRVQQLDEQVIKTVNQGEQLNSIVPTQQSKLAQNQTQYDQLKEELAKYNKPETENQLRQLYRKKKTHEMELNSFNGKLNAVRKQHEQMFEVMRVNDQKLKQFQQKIKENGKILLTIDEATKKATDVSNDLFSIINHCHLEQDRLKTEIEQIESTIYTMKQQLQKKGGLDNMFNKIMQQNIPGVYGRLGDIAKVNEQYDEIVTSCLGFKLDNIVVQNYEAASAVIQFLKKGKIGRASCIILQTIKQFQAYMGHFSPLPESKRVFDMIQPKFQQAALAFYFVLRDTLYVKDSKLGLTYAMEDERNLRRVISQKKGGNGFIIYEINGIMNGCPKKRGGFETKANYTLVKKTEKDIKELQQGKERYLKKIKQVISKKQTAKKQLDVVNNDIAHLKKQKTSLQTSIKNYKQQMLDLQKSNHVRTDWSYQQNFEHKKKKVQKELQALEIKVKVIEGETKEITQLINEKEEERKIMQSENINEKREKFKKLKQENQNLSKTINHNLATMLNVKKKVQDFNKKKIQYQNRIKVLKSQIQKMKSQQKRIEEIAVQIYAKVTKHEARKSECENLDHEMRILLEEENKQIAQSKQKIQNSRINLEKCKKQKREKQEQIKQIQQQLNKIRNMYKKNKQDYPEDYKEVEKMLIKGEKLKPEQDQNQLTKLYKKQSSLQIINEITPLDDFSSEKINEFMIHQDIVISVLKVQRQKMLSVSAVNVAVIKQYQDKYAEYILKLRDFESIYQKQQQLRSRIDQLKKDRLKIFLEGFEQINSKLRQVFQLLTKGGDASLDLIDSLDPFSDGIKFSVRPYKKAWKEINKLSGGEKTLSSLSLIFALHYYRPTPIYFMDQIDAALDYRNVSIVAQYIKKRTKNAQFIIISLRNNMFQISDKLIGIYKIDDKTRVLQYQVCGEEGSTNQMEDD